MARRQQWEVVTICGSMRYYKEMLSMAETLTLGGIIVHMPFAVKTTKMTETHKKMLDEMHRVKIDLADRVLIVGAHIGESTQSEIDYANKRNKPVNFVVPPFDRSRDNEPGD